MQIMLACVLGAMFGFAGSFIGAPGLWLALVILLLILNANIGLAGLMAVACKTLSFILAPVTFAIGRVLLDGPTQPLFKAAINAPVTAWFGFERYITTGGLALGLVFGVASGILLVKFLQSFRAKMGSLEEGSDRYKQITSRKLVRFITWLLFGKGHGKKKSYSDLATMRKGLPIRPLGVVLAILIVGGVWVVVTFFTGPILTSALRKNLEQANGATVDIDEASLDVGAGRLVVTGLAAANPDELTTDLFRAARLEADVDTSDLLRKRMTIDRVVISEALTGATRERPGKLIAKDDDSSESPTPPPTPEEEPESKPLEDYISDAEEWKERLETARKWLEKLSRPGGDAAEDETVEERIKRSARVNGYANVFASHLVDNAPTLLIREVIAEGVKSTQLDGTLLDVTGSNLSTQPWLVEGAPRIDVKARDDSIRAEIDLAGATSATAENRIALEVRGLDANKVGASLTAEGEPLIRDGTIDAQIRADLGRNGSINAPLNITLHNSTVTLPQVGSSTVSEFKLPITILGTLDSPRIAIDEEVLAKALADAGAKALADKVRAEADEAIDKAQEEVKEKIEEEVGDKVNDLLDRFGRPGGGG